MIGAETILDGEPIDEEPIIDPTDSQEKPTPDAFDLDAFDPEADQAEFNHKGKWSDLSGAEKDRILTRYAKRTLTRLQDEGRVVRLHGEIVLVTPEGRWAINHKSIKLDAALHKTTKVTSSTYIGRQIVDRVMIQAQKIAQQVTAGRYAIITDHSVIVSAGNGIFEVDASGVTPVAESKKFYFDPVGKSWTYTPLSDDERLDAARMIKRLLADSQAIDPRSRMSLAIAQAAFPFIRSRMPTRPVFPGLSNQGGEGKSFGKDRFSYLLYGHSGLKTATQAALQRSTDPLVILDDQDDLAGDLMLHMKRGATGSHHSSVKHTGQGFEVENSSQADSIFIFTATRLPKDHPFISRFWPSSYSKRWFSPEFRGEGKIRDEILRSRDKMLSFILELLAEAFRDDSMPDLDKYGTLPYARTYEAFQWLMRLLRAFDRLAPGVIEPEKEFTDFIAVLREEDSAAGLATDELTILDSVFQKVESAPNCYVEDGLTFDEFEGDLTGTATSFSTVLNKEAVKQGKRLRNLTANNVGRWLAGEVNSSGAFKAEQEAIGSGNQKRRVWRVSRRG